MLTHQELLALAPSAGATTPAAHCSDRYNMVPTMDVLAPLMTDGFVPVEARQDTRRTDSRWGEHLHCRHIVRLRMQGTQGWTKQALATGCVPELVLTNSSDGSCPLELRLGIFRKVCSNGLIVFSEEGGMGAIHRNTTAADVIARAQAMSRQSLPLFDKIKRWSSIRLNPAAEARYAAEALLLRVGGNAQRAANYDAATLSSSRRPEDDEPTLWNLFNRVQEASMRGLASGFVRTADGPGRAISMRPIMGISSELHFNEHLWQLTESWASLVKKGG